MEGKHLHSPDEFTQDHRAMMYAADRLNGGGDFVDADAKAHDGLPLITEDLRVKRLNEDESLTPEEKRRIVDELVKAYKLDTIAANVKEHAKKFADEDRLGVISREADTADMWIRLALAKARGEETPSYEEIIRTVTGKDPQILDSKGAEVEEVRELMIELLGQQGYHVTNPRTLDRVVKQWEHDLGNEDTSDFEAFQRKLQEAGADYMKILKREVLIPINPAFADLPLTGLDYIADPNMPFDAFLAYYGGQDEMGKPLYKGQFKWNSGRPSPWDDVKYITGHESTHFAEAVVQDYLRRQGKLGSEAAFTTMSSPMALQTEGLAQVAPEMVSGGTLQGVIDRFGLPFATMSVQDRLQDMVRVWIGQQVALVGKDRLTLGEIIETDFLQTKHIANKYVKPGRPKSFWAQLEPGWAYGPSYYEGSKAYRAAIAEHGVLPVARAAFHLDGLTDLVALKAKLARQKNK